MYVILCIHHNVHVRTIMIKFKEIMQEQDKTRRIGSLYLPAGRIHNLSSVKRLFQRTKKHGD